MPISCPRPNRPTHGFSLTEVAIGLTIIGLILAAIWIIGGGVMGKTRSNQFQDQIIHILQNTRTLFRVSGNTNQDAPFDNGIAFRSNIFPPQMIRGNPPALRVVHVYGGAVLMGISNVDPAICGTAPVSRCFTLALDAVPRSACVDLISRLSGTQDEIDNNGLVRYNFNAAGDILPRPTSPDAIAANRCTLGRNNIVLTLKARP